MSIDIRETIHLSQHVTLDLDEIGGLVSSLGVPQSTIIEVMQENADVFAAHNLPDYWSWEKLDYGVDEDTKQPWFIYGCAYNPA